MLRLARDADLIHTTTFAAALPAWLAAKRRRKPLVLTVHEVWIGQWRNVADASWLSNTAHELMERLIYLPNYQNYVAVSQATATALQKIGVVADKITTIHNGLDYSFWNPKRYDGNLLRTQMQLQDHYLFLFTGRPGRSKGLPILLQALAKIVDQHPHATLVALLSHAPACQAGLRQAQQLITDLRLQAHVRIIPSVPKDDLPNWVAMADCVVVPSLSEGFGFAAAEASAMHKPVIATNNASLPEVVSGAHLLIPPNDVEALANALQQALQQDFIQTPPRQFLLADNLQNHLNLYERLLPT
jgi:glycosyltransferase involved in cell wall biosynthesis